MKQKNILFIPGHFIPIKEYDKFLNELINRSFDVSASYPYPTKEDRREPLAKLEDLVPKLGLNEFYIVAHSSGSDIANEFIEANKEDPNLNIQGAIYFAPNTPVDQSITKATLRSLKGAITGSAIDAGFCTYFGYNLKAFLETPEEMVKSSKDILNLTYENMKGHDLPSCFIFSENDHFYNGEYIKSINEKLEDKFPNLTLMFVEGKHNFIMKHAEDAATITEKYISWL